jgi:CheY-like chemotaxis protein
MPSQPTRTIFYADDDEDDIALLREAFVANNHSVNLIEASDGESALNYLLSLTDTDTWPCLIILDINMPRMDGKQALMRIKKHERLKDVPVIMFSTSNNQLDVVFFKQWGVELIQKPINTKEIQRIADTFIQHCK